MDEYFKTFCENIQLTSTQLEDAQTKYRGVCKKLHDSFYETEYNGNTKFLFGSYKNKTSIRPISEFQDVDVLFKMPVDEFDRFDSYESNGQAALLQEIKNILKEKYSTTDTIKAWGKVVLVKFTEGTHNIELLPAWENDNGTFKIPNSENGGKWEIFDPRDEINRFNDSNSKTDGYTADLIRMIKRWNLNTTTVSIKSYEITNFVISFLDQTDIKQIQQSERILKFFKYIKNKVSSDNESNVQTAIDRATKAIDYEKDEEKRKASEEWKKIFGEEYPLATDDKKDNASSIATLFAAKEINIKPKPWLAW